MQRAFLRQPKKSLRSVVVGAGFGGLGAAHKFQNISEIPINFTIYEKNPSIAGTWYENTYPGVGCDVPAALYTFPFAPNPLWKRFYASGPEIKTYIEDVAKSHDLTKNVQLNSKVTSAQWDDGTGQWKLEVDTPAGKIQDTADILINAGGIFNNWNWPNIEGLKDFEGELLHTANWDESFDAKGKMIGVIGNGSSAVQVMPALQKEAKGIKNFFRNPTWLSAPFLSDPKANESSNPEFSEEQRAEWVKDPESYRAFRKGLEHNYNKTYNAWIKGSSTSQRWKESIIESTKAIVGDDRKDLLPFVLPSYNLGCRRVSPGPDYLKALKADNVKSKMTGITKVVKDGLIDGEGEYHKLDAIVCATGFDTSYVPKWPLSGRDGATLNKNWEETPTAYLGIMTKDFPNYMMIGGPNTPTGHGSLTRVYDWQENYILSWLKKFSQEKLHSFVPKAETQDAYNVWLQETGEKLTFSEPCRSWWKNGKVVGPITAVYTGSLLHYHELLSQGPRGEDFDMRYTGRPFDFFGEGVTKREVERGDLAYYIDEEGKQK